MRASIGERGDNSGGVSEENDRAILEFDTHRFVAHRVAELDSTPPVWDHVALRAVSDIDIDAAERSDLCDVSTAPTWTLGG